MKTALKLSSALVLASFFAVAPVTLSGFGYSEAWAVKKGYVRPEGSAQPEGRDASTAKPAAPTNNEAAPDTGGSSAERTGSGVY